MGTEVSVLASAAEVDAAAAVTRSLFARWERVLTRFDPGSELSRLNRAAGGRVVVSELMLEVVATALEAARATAGVFDPTLLLQLARAGYDRTFSELPAARPAPALAPRPGGDWRRVEVHRPSRTIRIPAGCGLDLGGIAKGMAADAAVAELADRGLAWAAVDAGGDIALHGVPSGLGGWPLAVETGSGQEPVITLAAGGLATSSTRARRWRVGEGEAHHLLDPRTGLPSASGIASVTVAAGTCAQAEVAAKAALILGEPEGRALLGRLGLAALLIREGGGRLATAGWPGIEAA